MKEFLKKMLNRSNKKIHITAEPHPKDTENIMYHRVEINRKLEDLLNRTMSVKNDNRLTVEEKYALIISTFMSIKKITDEMLESETLFPEKEYKKLRKEIKKEMNNRPSYIG